ncbi:hypothetical protein HanRHA438_Chr01g0035161 [Helianthus annuus]|uniref:Uncharacterized protein n=1 Tax=Helianthus annuus TaxID=4232 RepID=A0A9K3P5E1_HELAN|nr:hypothetical protein HanXRQr2_Chr01g0034281 [Helianthus annuus]KAJ0627828.1 hypothetical protein HanHA89_Chr01g0030091 [Helianthus annuus]KAJ0949116.1 hypothetical protein HanRHA438_Chr01g0035161 [Helianthus annuus]
MSYEGSYPSTTKKLLHPYWSFLAHVYLVCISGNKSGIDTLTTRHTSAVLSLVEGWKFNYSKCVSNDMMANVKTLNKKYWFKFPRFLQMILEAKYPHLQQTVSIYDAKVMNHMVYSMLNQVRTDVQVLFQNKKPLVKFGAFPEIAEQVQALINADFGEIEADINTESLTADKPIEDQPLSVNPAHTETVESISAEPENVTKDPMADLHPRKRSKRDPRISHEPADATSTNPEPTIPVAAEQPIVHGSGTPMSDTMIDFLLNPRAAMYMPAPKTGEGSSNTPSNADVLKAAELVQQAAKEAAAATEPNQERTHEVSSSPDNEELFENNEVEVLMKRTTALEEDKIFKDVQIVSLLEEITHKNQQIQELETNLGSLTTVVMDLKQKLEGKFPKEFAKPPKEYAAAEKAQMDKEHEEAIDQYIQNPPCKANKKKK